MSDYESAGGENERTLIVNTELLIKEVEKRPPLYNKELKEYGDRHLKEKMWGEVCVHVVRNWNELSARDKKIKGADVQKKWKNLKDCFQREITTQRRAAAGQGARKRRKYIHLKKLLFLLPFVKSRGNSGGRDLSFRENYVEQVCSRDPFDTELFISEVEKRPIVYNNTLNEYSKKDLRTKYWMEIGEIMYENWKELSNPDRDEKVQELQKKWKGIRDNFIKSIKQRAEAGRLKTKPKLRPYIYYKELQFLLPCLNLDDAPKADTAYNLLVPKVELVDFDEEYIPPDDNSQEHNVCQSYVDSSLDNNSENLNVFQEYVETSLDNSSEDRNNCQGYVASSFSNTQDRNVCQDYVTSYFDNNSLDSKDYQNVGSSLIHKKLYTKTPRVRSKGPKNPSINSSADELSSMSAESAPTRQQNIPPFFKEHRPPTDVYGHQAFLLSFVPVLNNMPLQSAMKARLKITEVITETFIASETTHIRTPNQ